MGGGILVLGAPLTVFFGQNLFPELNFHTLGLIFIRLGKSVHHGNMRGFVLPPRLAWLRSQGRVKH